LACVGKAKAVTATARKIAVLFYNTLRHGVEYSDPAASHYEETCRRSVLAVRVYPAARPALRLNVS